jgi:putative ABC transport system substrate-binding protein
MNRRQFASLLASVVMALPCAAHAQRTEKMPVIGVLFHAANAEEEAPFRGPLREGFTNLGYVEGKNIVFEERYPDEQPERFYSLAADLVRLKVDVLIAVSNLSALAAQRATSTIPIVFCPCTDPLYLKLVSSLARPGGNITGRSFMTDDIIAKRMQILKEAMPNLSRVALLVNPNNVSDMRRAISDNQAAADRLHIAVEVVEAGAPEELERAFSTIAEGHFDAVIVAHTALYFIVRGRIAELALANGLPTLAPTGLFAEAGALLAYGPHQPTLMRGCALYVDKILKGAKPADLPVQQPTDFELVVNLKTAKALGITLPPSILFQADKVIQ